MELTGYILFIPIIFFIVVFHELGHFLLAKLFNIEIEEFAIGFPPRIFAKKIFSTEISLNTIPLGGYVKLPSIDKPDNGDRFSLGLSIKKILVFASGSLFNFMLTFVIITLIYIFPHKTIAGDIYIQKIAPDSPADISGLAEGDVIKEINEKEIKNIDQLISSINKAEDISSSIKIERSKKLSAFNAIQETTSLTLKIKPRKNVTQIKVFEQLNNSIKEVSLLEARTYNPDLKIGDFMTEGKLGVLINMQNMYESSETLSLKNSIQKSYQTSGLLFKNLNSLFETNQESNLESRFTGPIGIAQITNQSSKQGLQSVAELVALISFSLGIFNLIPFPPLDGGKILFEVFTLFRGGKPVPNHITYKIQLFGMLVLFSLIILVTFSDIKNIINT